MNHDTLKTIGIWCAFIGIIALAVFGIRSCQKQNKAERDAKRAQLDYEYQQGLLNDEYVYQDINGIYHITRYCNMLNDVYLEKGDDEDDEVVYKRGNYSSQYINRSTIKDWHQFAATHQLCSECFTPELIRKLDSVRNNKVWRGVSAEEYDDYDD